MSRKSKKASAVQRAVGQGKPNKHITKITAKPANTPEKATKTSDRPNTAVKAENAAKRSEKASNAKTMSDKAAKTDLKQTNQPAAKADKKALKSAKKAAKRSKKANKADRVEKPLKEVFLLARPFVALGRYIRDSWHEIRRVRWPNRKATWKMTGAVLAYCAVFMIFIVLLDSFFTWFFSLIIK